MRMKGILLAGLLVMIIAAPALAEIKITGYMDVTYYDIQGSSTPSVLPGTPESLGTATQVNPSLAAVGTTNGRTNTQGTFDVAEVDLYFTAPLTDKITAYSELNSAGLGNVRVVEAFIEFKDPFNVGFLNINAGYFPPSFGLGSRGFMPTGRRNISQPMLNSYIAADVVGLQLFGDVTDWIHYNVAYVNSDPAGASSILSADNAAGNAPAALIGNGLGGTPNTSIGTLGRVATGGLTQDNNKDKTVLGRVGFTPVEMLELGVSGSTGDYLTNKQKRVMWGADATFKYDPIRISFEYLDVTEELLQTTAGATALTDAKAQGWYVEGAIDVPINPSFMPNKKTLYVRYEEMTFSGPQTLGTGAGSNSVEIDYFKANSFAVAAAYDFFENLTGKIEYQWNDEDQSGPIRTGATRSDLGDVENDVIALSMVATF